jgi:hypothetical protein
LAERDSDRAGRIDTRPELDLLDLALSGAHGLSLVPAGHARIRAPRCVVSASGEPDAFLRGRHLGFAGHVDERVALADVCSALDQWPRSRPRDWPHSCR